ncbi:hypothetical protein DNU06_12020 [Putridiphycobacter roseus]|uniref:Outer membrane protein beta-barrel domain-containing protein n=1 Tax=Putridiphycobacter roseus TaxID=2219161 RepID=A0A2W1MYV2_9FLAO|nr:outer membrane beta-barrel protein [Putridiphycobacter roseus]PZE16574.1 hypothetical protein DNU06_12020 [Putridiphycobacter roseus]
MKNIAASFLVLLFVFQSYAQEKRVYLNFFTGVASFKTDITPVMGDGFKSTDLYSLAPSGIGVGVEVLKNTFINAHFGTHRLYNDYLRASNDNGGYATWNTPATARNFGLKLKYQFNLPKSFKITPFVGYSVSYISQPAVGYSPYRQRGGSTSSGSINGVPIATVRDSIFSSTEFISNTFSGLSAGGELAYEFKNKLSLYLSYSLFYSTKYYAVQYGEYHSTAYPTQKAYTSFGKSGYFYQIGIRYLMANF